MTEQAKQSKESALNRPSYSIWCLDFEAANGETQHMEATEDEILLQAVRICLGRRNLGINLKIYMKALGPLVTGRGKK